MVPKKIRNLQASVLAGAFLLLSAIPAQAYNYGYGYSYWLAGSWNYWPFNLVNSITYPIQRALNPMYYGRPYNPYGYGYGYGNPYSTLPYVAPQSQRFIDQQYVQVYGANNAPVNAYGQTYDTAVQAPNPAVAPMYTQGMQQGIPTQGVPMYMTPQQAAAAARAARKQAKKQAQQAANYQKQQQVQLLLQQQRQQQSAMATSQTAPVAIAAANNLSPQKAGKFIETLNKKFDGNISQALFDPSTRSMARSVGLVGGEEVFGANLTSERLELMRKIAQDPNEDDQTKIQTLRVLIHH